MSVNVLVLGFYLKEVHHLHCHSLAAEYIYGIVLVPPLSLPGNASTSRYGRQGELRNPLSPYASWGILGMNSLTRMIHIHVHQRLDLTELVGSVVYDAVVEQRCVVQSCTVEDPG